MMLILVAAIVMPITLLFWVSTIIHNMFNNGNIGISPMRWMVASLAPILIASWGLKRKSLDKSGALAGLLIGFILTVSSYCFFTCLLVFFISASKATRFRSKWKKKLEHEFKEGGQRNWIQVLCNGGVAAQFALFYMIDTGCLERPIDFTHNYSASWYATAVVGALACSCGDTYASEIGTVVERNTQPRLITTFSVVPKGTNGAITMVGTLCSAIGGLFIGLTYYTSQLFICNDSQIISSPPQWPMILYGMICGLLGSAIDSVLGALFQYSGFDRESGKIVEKSGKDVEHIVGIQLIDNHSVNLISSLLCAVLMPKIAFSLWRYFV